MQKTAAKLTEQRHTSSYTVTLLFWNSASLLQDSGTIVPSHNYDLPPSPDRDSDFNRLIILALTIGHRSTIYRLWCSVRYSAHSVSASCHACLTGYPAASPDWAYRVNDDLAFRANPGVMIADSVSLQYH